MDILSVLRPVTFGQRVAEDEVDQLATYFVETDLWNRLYADGVDIIYGAKGAGKSALYSLLMKREAALFDSGVLLAAAENPRGATVFQSLVVDPPASEREFISLWKLYLAGLAASTLLSVGFDNEPTRELVNLLEAAGIRPRERGLKALLHGTLAYVRKMLSLSAVEGAVKLDPNTQLPVGLEGKIVFGQPSQAEAKLGAVSIDRLFELLDAALGDGNFSLWMLLDRLDVAFSESAQLEQNALRALFKAYLDLLALKRLRLKIFLRTDIWQRITEAGFREASHITRHATIQWNKAALLNLIVRRAAQNESILGYLGANRADALASADSQSKFFYEIFPDQVELGTRKPFTFEWMLSHTCDASDQAAPRELIHLLNVLRDVQVRHLEVGGQTPDGNRLFARGVFKEALPEVSTTRLTQTLYAEYPEARAYIEKLRKEKAEQSLHSLMKIWETDVQQTAQLAKKLVDIGLFQQRGDKSDPGYWVPFLYRDALGLVQGAAD